MAKSQPIIDFLSKPENLPIALEVASHIDALRIHLHQAFWQDMTSALHTRMVASSFTERWSIAKNGDSESKFSNCSIHMKNRPKTITGSILSVCLMQSTPSSEYQLSYGLVWSPKDRPAPILDSYIKLMERSKENGFSDKDRTPWWPACIYLGIYLRSDEFALEFGLNRTEFVDRLAGRVWMYFENIEPELFQLNQELCQAE